MRIGLISDIHANRPALLAVLRQLRGVDQIWCAGDITGYYTDPNGVMDDLLAHSVRCIKGNHDGYLETPALSQNSLLRQSIDFTLSRIKPHHRLTIQRLPTAITDAPDGLCVTMYHGSPWNHLEEYIYPDYPWFDKFAGLNEDVVVLGHTHYPLLMKIHDRLIINPGSCGQPRDGDPRAAYAILDTRTRAVSLHRVDYDASSLKRSIQALGLDQKLLTYLPDAGVLDGRRTDNRSCP